MIRMNNTEHCSVSQSVSFDFDNKTCKHIVTYHNSVLHVYDTWEFDTLDKACTAFEALEQTAKQFEQDIKEGEASVVCS